ncbi:hypothetical protein DV736_g5055, partial [Chaetothyriales sp. CBS 134916]
MSATATGGVRNLRAIFENKSASDQSTSPPSRGRSSSGSVASASSRPVSSVRTSFVTVDTPVALSQTAQGQLGKASEVGRMAEASEESSNAAAVASDATLTSPHQTTHPIEGGLGTILKGSSFEGTPEKETEKETGPHPETNGVVSRAAAMVERIKSIDKPLPPPIVHLNTTPTAQPVKPPHPKYVSPRRVVATANTPTSTPGNRLPIRGGPAKILGVMESAKEAREAREAARQEQTNKTTTATTAARDGRKAAAVEPMQKLAPRSRFSVPAKLPSAATAKTAASTAKSETEASRKVRSSTSRMSLAAGPTRVPSAVTTSTLAKKASRASLSNRDDAKSRASTVKPDESFLARMSRPTVSSASKTHDKVGTKSPRSDQSEATISEQNDLAVDEPATTNGMSDIAVEAAPTSNGDGVTSASASSAAADLAPET